MLNGRRLPGLAEYERAAGCGLAVMMSLVATVSLLIVMMRSIWVNGQRRSRKLPRGPSRLDVRRECLRLTPLVPVSAAGTHTGNLPVQDPPELSMSEVATCGCPKSSAPFPLRTSEPKPGGRPIDITALNVPVVAVVNI